MKSLVWQPGMSRLPVFRCSALCGRFNNTTSALRKHNFEHNDEDECRLCQNNPEDWSEKINHQHGFHVMSDWPGYVYTCTRVSCCSFEQEYCNDSQALDHPQMLRNLTLWWSPPSNIIVVAIITIPPCGQCVLDRRQVLILKIFPKNWISWMEKSAEKFKFSA